MLPTDQLNPSQHLAPTGWMLAHTTHSLRTCRAWHCSQMRGQETEKSRWSHHSDSLRRDGGNTLWNAYRTQGLQTHSRVSRTGSSFRMHGQEALWPEDEGGGTQDSPESRAHICKDLRRAAAAMASSTTLRLHIWALPSFSLLKARPDLTLLFCLKTFDSHCLYNKVPKNWRKKKGLNRPRLAKMCRNTGGNVKQYNHFGKELGSLTHTPTYYPAIPLLRIYPRKIRRMSIQQAFFLRALSR